ncbi:MAG: UDP-N-acetylmuramoyl-L-alanine--D-glutamate ligase [Clostridia bacterium]|nr:UDP-N-acetylmuramoyl-L-alanine--D-glutamate ligase [Clostridia bacterium]
MAFSGEQLMENYLIVGAGRSGIAAAQMLLKLNKNFIIYDGNKDLNTSQVLEKIGTNKPVSFILDEISENDLREISVCVVSPGVPLDTPVMKAVIQKNIPVWSEIELAYLYDKGTVLAITGTNGKTTTTSLTYEITKAFCEKTLLVGNIEIPYTGLALESVEGGFTVAEISSFQLETMVTFKPHVCAILNITPDHLDRHKSMENYKNIKKSIAKNQDENDFCVLNYEDEVLRNFSKELKSRVVFFSSERELDEGLYFKNGCVILAENGEQIVVIKEDEVNLVGKHNFENIMSAVAITYYAGIPLDVIREATRKFVAVEHRIEYTATKKGVKYYNDSKGTNTDAAIKAIDAMPSETVLIAGGYDKKSDYGEWISHLHGKCKLLILIGQTAQNIAAACDEAGFSPYVFADSMEEAVSIAQKSAKSGDCVLLSPACASWGMFKSYQQRGNIFKDLVRSLED